MPLPLTTAARNALAAREVAHAWLLELFTTEETLRAWDKNIDLSYESNTFEGIGDKWRIAGEISMGVDLVPEPLTISFDGSLQNDDTSFIGKLVDNQWHNRKVRLRGMLLDVSSEFTVPIGVHIDWNGFMDQLDTSDTTGQASTISLKCEGGTFRALDRFLVQCTDEDQRRRNANDAFMQNVALKPQQDVPFGKSWSKIAGSNGSSGGGGSFNGGGGFSGGFGRF
ncbi:MAG: hypothetical protein AAGL19_03445 [Pseudomonadota bacterium]